MEDITTTFNIKDIFSLIFYIAALILVIHIIVFSYHWYTFGANKKASLIGILVHIIGGGFILGALALSLWYI